MTLGQARRAFSKCLVELLTHVPGLGLEFAFDEVTERLTAKDPTSDHMEGSVHHLGLAADILLFLNGVYLTDSGSYSQLGELWESIGVREGLPLVWGGRFTKKGKPSPDGNHFSMRWNEHA